MSAGSGVRRVAVLAAAGLAIAGVARAGQGSDPDYARGVAEVKAEAQQLRTAAAAKDPGADHVIVTAYGGMPPPVESTTAASRLPDGAWAIDRVYRTHKSYAATDAGTIVSEHARLEGDAARNLTRLLEAPELYQVADSAHGTCTDQPVVLVDIAFQGRRKDALRGACPPDDRLSAITELIFSVRTGPTNSQK